MQYVAQPQGTTADQALTARGVDPVLIASNAFAFFNACKPMFRPLRVAGNNQSAYSSSVVALIGGFFIVTDPAVLAAMEAGQQISDAALASLVNFFAAAGASFEGRPSPRPTSPTSAHTWCSTTSITTPKPASPMLRPSA